MPYTIGDDGLLDFSECSDDVEKDQQAWDYFCENLSDAEVVAWDGKLVRGFTEKTFDHIVSGSTNRWDAARGHDIPFVEKRARCIPLIGKVIRGEIQSRCWRILMHRGKKSNPRKILTVIEIEREYFVVVLNEVKDRYAIVTAYPSDEQYYKQRIQNQGTNLGLWGGRK